MLLGLVPTYSTGTVLQLIVWKIVFNHRGLASERWIVALPSLLPIGCRGTGNSSIVRGRNGIGN